MKKQATKPAVIWTALVITLIATVWVSHESPEGEVALAAHISNRAVTTAPVSRTAAEPQLDFQLRKPITTLPGDLFLTDQQTDPLLDSVEMAAEPALPAMPLTYAGKYVEGSTTTAFLVDGQQNLLVREGDIIDSTWKVEAIAHQKISLTYMPLQMPVVLNTGEEF